MRHILSLCTIVGLLSLSACRESELDHTYGLRLTANQIARLEQSIQDALDLADEWNRSLSTTEGQAESSTQTQAWLNAHPMLLELFATQLSPFIKTASFPVELQGVAIERMKSLASTTLQTGSWAYEQASTHPERGEHYLLLEGLAHRTHGWALRAQDLLETFLDPDQFPSSSTYGQSFLTEEVWTLPPEGHHLLQWTHPISDSATLHLNCQRSDALPAQAEMTSLLPYLGITLASGNLAAGELWKALTLPEEARRNARFAALRTEVHSQDTAWISCHVRRFLNLTKERSIVHLSRKKRSRIQRAAQDLATLEMQLLPRLQALPFLQEQWVLLRQGIGFEMAITSRGRFDGVPFEHYYRMRFEKQARDFWRSWLQNRVPQGAYSNAFQELFLGWLDSADQLAQKAEP